jgi:hypothetical protein
VVVTAVNGKDDSMQAPNDLADALFADAVFRVGRAYGMTADRSIYQSVAITAGSA